MRKWCVPLRASCGGDLPRAGVKIAEYPPTMFHVKALVVDNLMAWFGSTNFDNRSFSLNDEANLIIIDPAFVKQQVAVFDDDWAKTKQITLAAWEARPWHTRMMGKMASLIGSQL